MKLMPLITAILVAGFLYLLVIQRDALMAFAQAAAGAGPNQTATEPAATAIRVVAMQSTAQTVDSAVILRGRTEAARQVEVRSETSGLVISEPLRKGSTVATGDLLCELDPGTRAALLDEATGRLNEARARLPEAMARVPEAEANKAEARARLSEARSRVVEAEARVAEAEITQNAATRLSVNGFASDTAVANAAATLESARAGLSSAQAAVEGALAGIIGADAGTDSAKAAIESAKATIQSAEAAVAGATRELDRLKIRAPFGGLLETDAAELGSLLQPGAPCATIVQLDPIKLVGFVPETDVGKVSLGAAARARLADGTETRGVVTYLSRAADEQTRTFRTEIQVPNSDQAISDGQTAEIMIAAAGRRAHLLPQSSLTLDDAGRLGVRTVGPENTATFIPVELLRDTTAGVWVAGLPDRVGVIVVGQEFVIDGVRVAPTWREADG